MSFRKLLKENLFLILIIVLASVLRLLWVDKIPTGITTDEMNYIFNARSVFLTGADITGKWNPLSVFVFQYPPFSTPQAELSYFILMPFVGILDFSLFSVRIPFVLVSIGSVYLIYLIAKTLFNQKTALFAAFVMSINPWQIYIGRTTYEVDLMMFLFLLSFYLLLTFKNKNILLSIPVLFLSFYSYIGTKVSFIFFAAAIVFFAYFRNGQKFKREYLTVFAACTLLVVIFSLTVFSTKGSRAEGLLNPNSLTIAKNVDDLRLATLNNPLRPVFENKYVVSAQIIFAKFINSFSFDYLFLNGDSFFSNLRSGFFYVFDFFFLVAGFLFMFSKKRKEFILLFLLLLIGVLPQLIYRDETNNFSPHVSLMFAILPIFIGFGIAELTAFFKVRYHQFTVSLIVLLIYFVSLFNFLNVYFYQFPIAGYSNFSERLVAKYLALAAEKQINVKVYSTQSTEDFKKYIFYSQGMDKNSISTLKEAIVTGNTKFGNAEFIGCDNTLIPSEQKDPILWDFICGNIQIEEKHNAIPRLLDGGESFRVYNDKVCSQYNLKPFPTDIKISDFNIETMPEKQFCETFVTSL